jgi:Siphovirus ReqiPepy6 Gp37-like protein
VKLSDITVEVRDKNLVRQGIIRPEDLDFTLSPAFNNVGSWKLTLASEHPLADVLRAPGSGIIVTGPSDVIASGPMVKPEYQATPTDPVGKLSFEGITDEHVLADMLAWPQPSNPDVTTQNSAHDIRTGTAEDVMHGYVQANIGPDAPVERRNPSLSMGASLARGPQVIKKARFPVMGDLLSEIAVLGNLGFRVVQRGSVLVFETYEIVDRSRQIRLDIRNGTLSSHRVAISPPGVTHVIVAGQDEGVDRQFLERTSTESLAAETEWARRIEFFKDQRNTGVVAELEQSGDEILADKGFTAVAIQVVPMEDLTMRFGTDWGLGDKVSVVVAEQELASTVTGMVMKVDSDGFKVGALIGDATGFDREAAFNRRVQDTERRVGDLERNAEVTDYTQQIDALTTDVGSAKVKLRTARAQAAMAGGDKRVYSARQVSWTGSIRASVGETSAEATSGYFLIDMPINGTVIPTQGSATTTTVASGKITLPVNGSLWYRLPYGSGSASVPAGFIMCDPTVTTVMPDDAVMVVRHVGQIGCEFRWGSGEIDEAWKLPTFQGTASTYPAYEPTRYKRVGNRVYIEGLVANPGSNTTIFTLPDGYRPPATVPRAQVGNGAIARVDYFSTGEVKVNASLPSGSYVEVATTFEVVP